MPINAVSLKTEAREDIETIYTKNAGKFEHQYIFNPLEEKNG